MCNDSLLAGFHWRCSKEEVTMEYTEEQKQSFREEFARRRKYQLAVIPLVFLGLAGFIFADSDTGVLFGFPSAVWGTVGFLLTISAIVFSLKNWRCPACNKYLGKGISPKFCQKCGTQLSQ